MEPLPSFSAAHLPEIRFGPGRVTETAGVLARFGRRVLLVTGRRSFVASPYWTRLLADLRAHDIEWQQVSVEDEPSPEQIDQTVAQHQDAGLQVVVGVGGGSVLDAAKAIAGLLPGGASVLDYLEGVGRGVPYEGPALPWVAVPTTAGTGSEATKNAVLSRRGPQGFKKSFRHEQLVARVAILDPQLLATCPQALIAANGMDAFTQLLESYVSRAANPFTDALALSGLEAFRDGFWAAWAPAHPEAAAGRTRLTYAALLSGITLAQAGLGSVHGLASPLGAYFPIPHGVVCGTLVAEATAVNIRALRERAPGAVALARYARVAELLSGHPYPDGDSAREALVGLLRGWLERLELPRLGRYGMTLRDLDRVVANCRGGSMRTNPLVLQDDELRALLQARL